MKDRLSNEHLPQTERERTEIAWRGREYERFHGSYNTIICGKKRFPYTTRGIREAIEYAKKTGEEPYPFRTTGKTRKRK